MKLFFLTVILFIFFSPKNSKAQDIDSSRYADFFKYIFKGFNPPSSVKKSCEWQYALVEVNTDINNKVISYTLLNKVSDDFKRSFNYLMGYEFPKKLHINMRPVVFCISINNEKSSCDLSRKAYSPTEVLGIFFANLTPLFESDPDIIFLPRILQVGYSFDSIR